MNETSSDLSSGLISPVLLRGDNYAQWSTNIRNSLQAKQKLGFIDGSNPKPLTDPDLTIWLRTNSMIVGWILATIDPKIRSTVDSITDANKLWETLQHRLYLGVKPRVYQLKINICACKQDGQSVDHYLERLCEMWAELESYKSECDCSCDAAKHIKKEKEDEKVYQFLMGLDDSMKKKINFIMSGKVLFPDLYQAYCLITEEERRLARSKILKPKPEGQHVQPRDKSNSCSHCGRKGHKVEVCFSLHGYPESRHVRERNKSSNTRGGRGRGVPSSSKSTNTQGRDSASQTIVTNQFLTTSGFLHDKFNNLLYLQKIQHPESNIYSTGPSASSSSNRFPMAQKMEAKGGNGGIEWDDGTHEGISQIYIREGSGGGIESIKFDYVMNGEPKAGPIHGSGYSRFTEWFDLNHTCDEHILSVECYFDEGVIQGLVIQTNIRTSAYMGYNIGTTFKLEVKGKKIIGFHGSFDKRLKSLGAYFTELSPDNLR